MGFDEYLSHDNFFELNPPLSRNGAPPEIHQGESSMVVVEAGSEFVKKVKAEGKPFFVILWFGSPHGPYSGLPEDLALYGKVPKDEMKNRFAEITAMDRAIGRFRATLKELGLSDNTLVWYTSDNGIPVADEQDSFNGGWRGRKGTIYEGGLRVPAIIEWPAVIKQHRLSNVPCVSSDIFPTLLDLTGLKSLDPKRPIDGISLRDLIESDAMKERPSPIGFWKYDAKAERKNPRWKDPELTRGTTPTTRQANIDFVNYRHPIAMTNDFGGQAAWTGNRYKLLTSQANKKSAVELFDLLRDPKEQDDIAAQNPDIVRQMMRELHDWQRSVERSLSGADY
jgi:arylsulfatase A-like enzyme